MRTNELLASIRVASPCPARWSHMIGDDRVRFCAQCQKHVYNLSSLTAEEATALIRAQEGKLCARFYQRADGMALTSDCPVGAAQVWVRFKRLLGAAAALALIGLCVPLFATSSIRNERPRARAKVYRAWDDALAIVKSWLVRQPPPRMLMGAICVPPPPARPAPPPPPTQ